MEGTNAIYPCKSIRLSFESTQDSRVSFLFKLMNLSLHVTLQIKACNSKPTEDFSIIFSLLHFSFSSLFKNLSNSNDWFRRIYRFGQRIVTKNIIQCTSMWEALAENVTRLISIQILMQPALQWDNFDTKLKIWSKCKVLESIFRDFMHQGCCFII